MKKTLIILSLVAFSLFFLALFKTHRDTKKKQEFYDIVCGQGENQTSYISKKRVGDDFEIQGEMRNMKGCQVNEIKP